MQETNSKEISFFMWSVFNALNYNCFLNQSHWDKFIQDKKFSVSIRIEKLCYYFRANLKTVDKYKYIVIAGDTTYTSFYEYGHSFVFNKKLISYGYLAIRNWLIQVIPDDLAILSKFRNFYVKRKTYPPEWLEKLYKEKVLKRKSWEWQNENGRWVIPCLLEYFDGIILQGFCNTVVLLNWKNRI